MGPTPTRTSSPTSARESEVVPESRARILARMSVRDARVHTCKRVLYTISYRVHVYKINDRHIRVGVGPMEFKLNGFISARQMHYTLLFAACHYLLQSVPTTSFTDIYGSIKQTEQTLNSVSKVRIGRLRR